MTSAGPALGAYQVSRREREPGCQIVGGTPVAFFLAAWIWQGGRLGRAVGMGAGAGVGVGLVWVRPDPHVGVGPVWVCADPGVGVCCSSCGCVLFQVWA